MIDLSRIFKNDSSKETSAVSKPEVSAIVVLKQSTEDATNQIRQVISDAGFSTDTVIQIPEDEEAVVYAQKGEDSLKDATIFCLSNNLAVALKGFDPNHPELNNSGFQDSAASGSFYQSADASLDKLFSRICTVLQKSENEAAAATEVGTLIDGFKSYMTGLVKTLPTAAFKADFGVQSVVLKMEGAAETSPSLSPVETLLAAAPEGWDSTAWGGMTVEAKVAGLLNKVTKKDSYTKPDHVSDEDWGKMSDDEKGAACAKKVDETPATPAVAAKADTVDKLDEVLVALKGVTEQVTALNTRVDEFATKSEATQNKIDELATKHEDISKRMATTVVAMPSPGDSPSGSVVTKSEDEDLRTGSFDTAMISRRKKYDRF